MSEKESIVRDISKPPWYLGTIQESSGSNEWEKAEHGISWVSGSFMLMNVALGSALLNIPELYDKLGGIASTTFIQIAIILVSISTMYVMCACSDLDDVDTYDETVDYMCGRIVQKLSALSIAVTCFGICVTYLIVIGDQMEGILVAFIGKEFCEHWYLHRDFIIFVVSFVFIWPVSYARHIPKILILNYLGVFASIFIVLLSIYQYYKLDIDPGVIKTYPEHAKDVISVLPVMVFAYQTHVNLIPIYGSFRERSLKSMMKSSTLAMIVLFIMYSIIGIFGYLTFGDKVVSNFMKGYKPSDEFVFLGFIAFIFKMVTTYPQIMFSSRQSYYSLIGSDANDKGTCSYFVSTGIINVLVLFVALIIPNLSEAVKYLGSLSACSVFVFPGICMTILANSESATMLWSRVSCIILFIYGLLITMFGIFIFLLIILNLSIETNDNTFENYCK